MGDIVQFPQYVAVKTIWSEGVYGLTVDHVKKVTVNANSVFIWFKEVTEDDEKTPWDLELMYSSVEEANDSYHGLLNALRQLRFKAVVDITQFKKP